MRSKSRYGKRIGNRKAFTLAEALVALIIVLLVSAVIAAGIPSALNAYRKIADTANSQVILSTTMGTLRNELLTAKNVNTDTDNTLVTYTNDALDAVSTISKAPSNYEIAGKKVPEGTILFQRYPDSDVVRLISEEASDKDRGMYVTYNTVHYYPETKVLTFNELAVKDSNNNTKAERENYSIRIIAE